MPVTPAGTVSSPNDAPTAAAAADKIALVLTTIVTVLAPPVLSMTNSKIVPAVACNSAPKRVPVGNVIFVPAADVAHLTEFVSYELPGEKSAVKMIDPENMDELVALLHSEAKVI